MAHITGGGITDNLPRILPPGTRARIDRRAWSVPPLFRWLQATGDVPDADMLRTFNMGVGLILATSKESAPRILERLAQAGEAGAVQIGEIEAGQEGVVYAA
jgi:phosphoribosylformylglycinamidine cyclo-ligase